MTRPCDWSPLDQTDPIPGDPGRVRAYAANQASTATAIGEAYDRLVRITSGIDMRSDALDSFRVMATKVQLDIIRARSRYKDAADTLNTYAQRLEAAQSRSVELLTAAKESQQDARSAQYRAKQLAQNADSATDPIAHKQAVIDLNREKSAINCANAEVGRLRAELDRVVADRDAAAATAKQALFDAEACSAIKSEGFFDRLKHAVKQLTQAALKALDKIAEAVMAVSEKLAEVLSVVADVLGGAALIASFIPGLQKVGAALWLASTAVAAASAAARVVGLVAGSYLYLRGKLDSSRLKTLLGAAAFGIAVALPWGRVAKVGVAVVKGAVRVATAVVKGTVAVAKRTARAVVSTTAATIKAGHTAVKTIRSGVKAGAKQVRALYDDLKNVGISIFKGTAGVLRTTTEAAARVGEQVVNAADDIGRAAKSAGEQFIENLKDFPENFQTGLELIDLIHRNSETREPSPMVCQEAVMAR